MAAVAVQAERQPIIDAPREGEDLKEPLPAGLISAQVRKPLGIVLGERGRGGEVFVEEITPGGNAEKNGVLKEGDVLVRVSATILKKDGDPTLEEGYGVRPYTNWQRVMFDCRGVDFNTVMSAIGSNNERWGINDVYMEVVRGSAGAEKKEE
ncbi:unnamed protein product [Pedinophyceae sp. YPF-701]|nr:unnamed protein product [Pedinophyceae sp. YPF-701]